MACKLHVNDFFISKGLNALLLLNSASMHNPVTLRVLQTIWPNSVFKICADGGANRLFDAPAYSSSMVQQHYIPDFITGDLDSVRPDVAEYYRVRGSEIIRNGDQESNDLDKALNLLRTRLATPPNHGDNSISATGASGNNGNTVEANIAQKYTVVILGALGGRFDQELANLHALYRWQGTFQRMVLLSEEGNTFLLEGGYKHSIRCIQSKSYSEGPTCGIVPLGQKVHHITTSGLQWNLQDEELDFKNRISTSNRVLELDGEVIVEASESVLWTCESSWHEEGLFTSS